MSLLQPLEYKSTTILRQFFILSVMDEMFVSCQNPYIEALSPDVIVLGSWGLWEVITSE